MASLEMGQTFPSESSRAATRPKLTCDSEYKTYMRKFYDTQTQVYENNGQGWIHWTWKTEAAADWSYSAGLNGGWIPWDPTSHIYQLSDLCN